MQVKLAYHANCWGALGGNAVGVTSITQLTYRTFGDMEQAIRDIGAAGYAGTELFDGNLLDYEGRYGELRGALKQCGVVLVAGYSGANFIFDDILGEELARIERVAGAAAELGAEHLVVGGGAKRASGRQQDDFKRLGAALDKVIDIAAKAGLRAHYHPHLSTIVEGPDEVREVFRHTAIDFCPDTAHLAAAGGDPAAQIREFRDRISYVHLKGWQRDPFAFTPLDRGDLAMAPIVEALKDIGFSGWIAAELDAWPDPKQGAELSMDYLKKALGPS
ncbi:sugar phosphate isomerase/epimerase [Mesorhizobium sp. BH1-1-5]|uniref:sugar phosphate isomerase/epimerase family protein n=1 Tax=Mesorhizobium sp. BH1-1-5 TaxID=2876661 RepID=UPI001CCEE978|nr:sugar phosphate isomerase/epimerase [Mesorhizobium sp. BH1-1-5]MBZ9985936.1 sugar phosphate isomerase/epimerase [Mesorhizobium sp. BH1-1-5]